MLFVKVSGPQQTGLLVPQNAQNRAFTSPLQVLNLYTIGIVTQKLSIHTNRTAGLVILAITLISCHAGDDKMLEMIMLGISVPVGVAVSIACCNHACSV